MYFSYTVDYVFQLYSGLCISAIQWTMYFSIYIHMVHVVMPCHSHVCVHLCGLCERHPLTSTPPLPSFQRVVDTEAHYRLELEAMRKRHHKKFADATERIRTQHKDLAKRYVAVEKQLQKSSVSGNKSCPFCAFLVRVPCCSVRTYIHTYVRMCVCMYVCMYVCTLCYYVIARVEFC